MSECALQLASLSASAFDIARSRTTSSMERTAGFASAAGSLGGWKGGRVEGWRTLASGHLWKPRGRRRDNPRSNRLSCIISVIISPGPGPRRVGPMPAIKRAPAMAYRRVVCLIRRRYMVHGSRRIHNLHTACTAPWTPTPAWSASGSKLQDLHSFISE